MTVLETIKQNPFKTISLIITVLSLIGTAVITIDTRYAHAGSFESYKQQISDEFNEYKVIVEDKIETTVKKIDALRIKQLQDKVFELNFLSESGKARPIDKALLDRYRNELKQSQEGSD